MNLRHVVAIVLPAFLAGAGACGGGGGGGSGSYEKAVADLVREIGAPARTFADAARAEYERQLDTAGSVNATSAVQALQKSSTDLGNAMCSAKAKNKRLAKPKESDDTSTLRTEAQKAVSEAFIGQTAANPKLLVAFGLDQWGKWPPSLLKEPAVDAATPVQVSPDELSKHVKAEFLTGTGEIKVPVPEDPSFHAFEQWYLFDPNGTGTVLRFARSTAVDVSQAFGEC